MGDKKKVAVIGSGNWGTAVARQVARNIFQNKNLQKYYEKQVDMYVYEEKLKDGRNLTDAINTDHVNIKYLPDASLPVNLVAQPNLADAVKDAMVFILVPPHQFVRRLSTQIGTMLTPEQKKNLMCVSLAKGIEFDPKKKIIRRMSEVFAECTGVSTSQMAALSGANLANEVAADMYAETSIAAPSAEVREEFFRLFNTDNFVIRLSDDIAGVELGGALKNIIAVAAGVVDGLQYGNNTKSSIVAAGLEEMIKFGSYEQLGHISKMPTFLGPAGVADLITTCFGGRNRMFGEQLGTLWRTDPEYAKSCSLEKIEEELLKGQKVQGMDTANEVYTVLKAFKLTKEFPVFESVYEICYKRKDPRKLYCRFTEKKPPVFDVRQFMSEDIGPYADHLCETFGVKYKMQGPAGKEVLASLDQPLFRAVIKRMLSKAARHTPAGKQVVISIKQAKDTFTININNPGKGIAAKDLPAAIKKMATTEKIVTKFGGKFYIESSGKDVDMGVVLPRA